MAYTTLARVKDYLDITSDTDDVLLAYLITQAQTAVNTYTGRVFEAATQTRYFESWALDDDGRVLWVDRDLLSITTLTNGDSSGTAIPNTEYWLCDSRKGRNLGPPYHGIRMKAESDYYWQWDTDYWVTVVGTWGYSTTAPNDVVHATNRMVAYYYAQKDDHNFDVTAVPEAGVITVPQGMPKDVKVLLGPYCRTGLA